MLIPPPHFFRPESQLFIYLLVPTFVPLYIHVQYSQYFSRRMSLRVHWNWNLTSLKDSTSPTLSIPDAHHFPSPSCTVELGGSIAISLAIVGHHWTIMVPLSCENSPCLYLAPSFTTSTFLSSCPLIHWYNVGVWPTIFLFSTTWHHEWLAHPACLIFFDLESNYSATSIYSTLSVHIQSHALGPIISQNCSFLEF